MNKPTDLLSQCTALLADAGIKATAQSLVPCNAGGNNRTFRLETSAGAFAIKQYFRHEGDTRDRLAAEFGFLQYAAKAAPGMAPVPMAMDSGSALALYEFIEGYPYKAGEITWQQVDSAANFFNALNKPNARKDAATLPTASEACFSIFEHLKLITARLDRLRAIEIATDEDYAALTIIGQIRNHWLSLSAQVTAACMSAQCDPYAPLESDERCVSPSDFGFHNALAQADGIPRFLDFEYAGWDDPAKMAGDFFAQLAVPIPDEYFERFLKQAFAPLPHAEDLAVRARMLRPVYQVKWCCIALNVFLPINLSRRKFANPDLDERALKQQQLAKVKRLFQSILSIDHGLH
jgi:hypothetical protein